MNLQWSEQTEELFTWDEASEYVEKLNQEKHLGYSDWRTPTIQELLSLVDYTKLNPASFDPTMKPRYYWSSMSNASYSSYAWGVDFGGGSVYRSNKSCAYFVRAVRTVSIIG